MSKSLTAEEKKEEIYRYILKNILTHQYPCGFKLPELEIAEAMGTSRTPVREVIQRLAWDGMVRLDANKGAFVIDISEEDMRDLALVRLKTAEIIIPLAIYNGSPRQYAELRRLADRCILKAGHGDLFERNAIDADFHLKLVEICGNAELLRLQRMIHRKVQFWLNGNLSAPDDMAPLLEEHFQIIRCMEDKDRTGAIRHVQHHIMTAYAVEESVLEAMNIRLL